ncbi:hypothetical protein CCHR01_14913 [Colletotrichum chrysophilum]|uniref:Uncharacterized protein n=1 Tax=Colletotrichum chrysophilum TaxID=1836956 RepID=A0AAD9ECA1_9PEZI|nr:hypothetical protein CCHR01_14913 [Colletotrichum chrysophilum]
MLPRRIFGLWQRFLCKLRKEVGKVCEEQILKIKIKIKTKSKERETFHATISPQMRGAAKWRLRSTPVRDRPFFFLAVVSRQGELRRAEQGSTPVGMGKACPQPWTGGGSFGRRTAACCSPPCFSVCRGWSQRAGAQAVRASERAARQKPFQPATWIPSPARLSLTMESSSTCEVPSEIGGTGQVWRGVRESEM